MRKRVDKYVLMVGGARFSRPMSLPMVLDLLQATIEHDIDSDTINIEIRIIKEYEEEE